MKNIFFAGVFLLLLVVAVNQAQERQMDCGNAYAMALEIDALYNDFLMARSEVDMDANLRAVQEMQAGINDLLAACETAGNAVETEETVLVAHLGSGTPQDPYGYNQPAPADEWMQLRAVELRRPATDWLANATESVYPEAQEGQEYVAVSVEVICPMESNGSCETDHSNFRLTGDLGETYIAPDVRIAERMDLSVFPSQSEIGILPFLIDAEDTNLTLIYSPDAFASQDGWIYYRAQAAIEVIAQAQLVVRGGPGTQFAPQGGLVEGQIASAIGRNDDASWLRIPDGWVFAQYLHLRAGDVFLLPVVEE
jgi:hypothetical protein